MLRGVLIAWAVCAGSFVLPAGTLRASASDGSVDAAAVVAIDSAPNRPASTQPDPTAPRLASSVATARGPAHDATSKARSAVDLFDRRAERRRVLPRRAPPRLGDDRFH